MNLCIVSLQAVLFAVLVQYHYINEVDAEKKSYVSIGNWYNGMEKKANDVQIRMNKVFQRIKMTTENILAYPSHFIHKAFGTGTDNKKTYNKDTDNRDTVNKDHNEGVKTDLLNSQELRDPVAVNDISDMTSDDKYEVETEPEEPRRVATPVFKKQEAHKRKRRIKKHKKKNKGKDDQQEHLPREQRLDASVEQDNVQFGNRDMRKHHKKSAKKNINQRRFVKTLPKESNSSESDEVIRRKPVDIIVHIKMND